MSNYRASIDLAKLRGAQVINRNGEEFLVVRTKDYYHGRTGAIYADLYVNESRQSQYGDSHYITQAPTAEQREKGEKTPIVGNMKPSQPVGGAAPAPATPSAFPPAPVASTAAPATADPELPF